MHSCKQEYGRLREIDRAKGLAIILVVLGHLVVSECMIPQGGEWYQIIREIIYRFHMPFFMYLSGFVTFWAGHHKPPPEGYIKFIRNRAKILLLPFWGMGIFVLCGKIVAGNVLHVDRVSSSFLFGLISLVWNTGDSPARFIWYVFVLFVFCVVTPFLFDIFRKKVFLILIFAAVIFCVPFPPVMFLPRISAHYIFFVLGGISALNYQNLQSIFQRYLWLFFIIFSLSVAIGYNIQSSKVTYLITGLTSIPFLHGLMNIRFFSSIKFLSYLGNNTLLIYFFNTIFIGLAKAVMLVFIPWNSSYFPLFLSIMFISGTGVPLLISEGYFGGRIKVQNILVKRIKTSFRN